MMKTTHYKMAAISEKEYMSQEYKYIFFVIGRR